MWSCKLQTTPEEKTIPEHQQDGIIHIDNNNHIHWISKGHTRSPVSIPLQTVKRTYLDVLEYTFDFREGRVIWTYGHARFLERNFLLSARYVYSMITLIRYG